MAVPILCEPAFDRYSPGWIATAAMLKKNVLQLAPFLLATTFCFSVIQFAFWSINLKREPGHGYDGLLETLLAVLPLVFGVGVAGLSLASERETRTWNWMSSIPIHWSTSLLSYLAVSIGIASLCLAINWIVFAILSNDSTGFVWGIGYLESYQSYSEKVILSIASGFVSLILSILFCSLAILLIPEGLTAIATGVGVSMVLQTVVLQSLARWVSVPDPLWLILDSGLLLAVPSALLLGLLYRWRWYVGQSVAISSTWSGGWFERRPATGILKIRMESQFEVVRSPFWALVRHSIRSGVGFYGMIGAWSVGCCLFRFVMFARFHHLSDVFLESMVGWPTAILLGGTLFASDHSHQRFRFLADKGIEPMAFYGARLLFPLGYVLVIQAMIRTADRLIGRFDTTDWVIAAYQILVFFLGTFASLCMRRSVIALVTAFGSSLIFFLQIVYAEGVAVLLYANRSYPLSQIPQVLTIAIMIGVIVGLSALWLVRCWMIEDRPHAKLVAAFWICFATFPFVLFPAVSSLFAWSIPTDPIEPSLYRPLSAFSNRPSTETSVPWSAQVDATRGSLRIPDHNQVDALSGLRIGLIKQQLSIGYEPLLDQYGRHNAAARRNPSSSRVMQQLVELAGAIVEHQVDPRPIDVTLEQMDKCLIAGIVWNDASMRVAAVKGIVELRAAKAYWDSPSVQSATEPESLYPWQLMSRDIRVLESLCLVPPAELGEQVTKELFASRFPKLMSSDEMQLVISNQAMRRQHLVLRSGVPISNDERQIFRINVTEQQASVQGTLFSSPFLWMPRREWSRAIHREWNEDLQWLSRISSGEFKRDHVERNRWPFNRWPVDGSSSAGTSGLGEMYAYYCFLRDFVASRIVENRAVVPTAPEND